MPEFKKSNGFKLKSGNKTSFKSMGSSPLKKDTGYSEKAQNLLKAVPDKAAYDKLSDVDKVGFDKAAEKHGLPVKKESPAKQVSGDAGEAIDHWIKYKKGLKKISTSSPSDKTLHKNLNKVADRYRTDKAIDLIDDTRDQRIAKNLKKSKKGMGKRMLKAFSHASKKAAKFATKKLGPVGYVLTAAEVVKTVPKVVKAQKKALKKEAKKRSKGKATDQFTGPKY